MLDMQIFGTGAVGLIVVLCLAGFWVVQFVRLMSMRDDRFPGQYDRYAWVAAFVLLWFITPFAFLLWTSSSGGGASSRRAKG